MQAEEIEENVKLDILEKVILSLFATYWFETELHIIWYFFKIFFR